MDWSKEVIGKADSFLFYKNYGWLLTGKVLNISVSAANLIACP